MNSLDILTRLPVSLEQAWDFFSSPENLGKITPADMNFRITSGNGSDKAYPGMIITYKVSPIMGIPMQWVTEITQVVESVYFIDEQKSGPYKFWHHQHHFRAIDGGTEMHDILHYALPFGFLGNFTDKLIVKKRLDFIFQYRSHKLEELFGTLD
jgi:ligand-binding SRPBCC domain-containing protein